MTGVADLYLYLKRPYSKDRRQRFLAHLYSSDSQHTRFVVLSWKRTGSNLLCGILHMHPEITMHNELFNPIDIFTYHPSFKRIERNQTPLWTVTTRDLFPGDFLDFVWTGMHADEITPIKSNFKAVGFKSFPEHWIDVRNECFWQDSILEDLRVKKIVLKREDELAVFVSMKRADKTGFYMTHSYPKNLTLHVDPAEFQRFVNNYRNTFKNKYRSPIEKRDTFHITYEDLIDEDHFETVIAPKLFDFLGVQANIPIQRLKETTKQANVDEDIATVISNYEELEFCFRHSDLLHFKRRRQQDSGMPSTVQNNEDHQEQEAPEDPNGYLATWSLLVPICSRPKVSQAKPVHDVSNIQDRFNANRFIDLAVSSQHNPKESIDGELCWRMLEKFGNSLRQTASVEQLERTECLIGIDIDDPLYCNDQARTKIEKILPCKVVIVNILPHMYGQVCRIWNCLGRKAQNDYVVLLGDDIELLDIGWQRRIVQRFYEISRRERLPLGAACVVLKDLAFPGFPTFPVVHRWHINHFGMILPKQFANQGGDPYLFELYSRYNASAFDVSCRLENSIGGDDDARYTKHQINWRGQILSMNLRTLKGYLDDTQPTGYCIDIVVPCFRVHNEDFLRRIFFLRASVKVYVKFWVIIDNPLIGHINSVQKLADDINMTCLQEDCNYFVNVIHYGENRGASYARNTGFNYTTADWVLFLDDDVIPDPDILDAYVGAIKRYPEAKVFVGLTELPEFCNAWTKMLRVCNVGYFYGIAKRMVHPSWGVTANLMVRGSRYNSTIQFKSIYPKTGGGEDIDFVYQFKKWYSALGRLVTVGVPEAKVYHPWWNKGNLCYRQIMGWAWGDSLCITEWRHKTFFAFPNWIEHTLFLLPFMSLYTGKYFAGLQAGIVVVSLEHAMKAYTFLSEAKELCKNEGLLHTVLVSLGAGSVLSSQEITRAVAIVVRKSHFSLCRRVDWFDGDEPRIKLDIQLTSAIRFGVNLGLTWWAFNRQHTRTRKV